MAELIPAWPFVIMSEENVILVQISTADKVEIDPQVPNRQSQLPAAYHGLGTPCQDK